MQTILADETLVQTARQGGREAFDALVLKYQYQAVALAQSILRNSELAKDASQNAFVKAYFGLKNFKESSQFKTWLFRIIINEAKDTLRKEKSRGLFKFQNETEQEGDSSSILELIPACSRSPKEEWEAKETKEKLEQAISSLPEREQKVFILRYLHYLSVGEFAQTLEIADGTVKAHSAHALEKVKSYLEKVGV